MRAYCILNYIVYKCFCDCQRGIKLAQKFDEFRQKETSKDSIHSVILLEVLIDRSLNTILR
jgi:hypothetical protein